jgi:hypothetical protein
MGRTVEHKLKLLDAVFFNRPFDQYSLQQAAFSPPLELLNIFINFTLRT